MKLRFLKTKEYYLAVGRVEGQDEDLNNISSEDSGEGWSKTITKREIQSSAEFS